MLLLELCANGSLLVESNGSQLVLVGIGEEIDKTVRGAAALQKQTPPPPKKKQKQKTKNKTKKTKNKRRKTQTEMKEGRKKG